MRVLLVCCILAAMPVAAMQTDALHMQESPHAQLAETLSLSLAPGATASTATFQGPTQAVNDVPVAGPLIVGDAQTEFQWASDAATEDREIIAAAVQLWISTPAPNAGDLAVNILDIAPNGPAQVIGSTHISLAMTGTSPDPYSVAVPISNGILRQGHFVGLHLTVEGVTTSVAVDYGDGATPSGMQITHQMLDTDGDGVGDSTERRLGTNPKDAADPADGMNDHDSDGLHDAHEGALGTNPRVADSDGDGFIDGAEYYAGTDPLDSSSAPDDLDNDGLGHTAETRSGTSDALADTDGNGINDCADDADNDGLSNCMEAAYGTDPLQTDSDGDGTPDGAEVAQGTDPRQHASPGPAQSPLELIAAGLMFAAATALIGVGLLSRYSL